MNADVDIHAHARIQIQRSMTSFQVARTIISIRNIAAIGITLASYALAGATRALKSISRFASVPLVFHENMRALAITTLTFTATLIETSPLSVTCRVYLAHFQAWSYTHTLITFADCHADVIITIISGERRA